MLRTPPHKGKSVACAWPAADESASKRTNAKRKPFAIRRIILLGPHKINGKFAGRRGIRYNQNSMKNQIILASASPRRKELLKKIVGSFKVVKSGIDESRLRAASPLAFARKAAVRKARAVA